MSKLIQAEQQFLQQLELRAQQQGWEVTLKFSGSQTPHVHFRCPHGKVCKEDIYPESLTEYPSVKGVADQYFRRAVRFCKSEHDEQKYYSVWPILKMESFENNWTIIPNPLDAYVVTNLLSVIGQQMISWGTEPYSFGAITATLHHPVRTALSEVCPALDSERAPCPLDHCGWSATLGELVPHVNDHHHWSREDIATWLESLDVDLTIQRKETDVQHSISA